MDILKEVFGSLDGWGRHPVFIEWIFNEKPVRIEAEEFKKKIIETAHFLKKLNAMICNFYPLQSYNNSKIERVGNNCLPALNPTQPKPYFNNTLSIT